MPGGSPWEHWLYFDANGCLVITDSRLIDEFEKHWPPGTTDFCVRIEEKKPGGGGRQTNELCTCRKNK